MKAAKAFLNKAIERVRLHRPVTIVTDKAPIYRHVIRKINCRYGPHFENIKRGHIHNKQSGITGEIQFISQLFEAA